MLWEWKRRRPPPIDHREATTRQVLLAFLVQWLPAAAMSTLLSAGILGLLARLRLFGFAAPVSMRGIGEGLFLLALASTAVTFVICGGLFLFAQVGTRPRARVSISVVSTLIVLSIVTGMRLFTAPRM